MGERLSKVLLKLPEQEYLGKFTKDLEHIRDDLIIDHAVVDCLQLPSQMWPCKHPKCLCELLQRVAAEIVM